MATAGSRLSEVDYLRQNEKLLEEVILEFDEAATRLDNSTNKIRRARIAGGSVSALGAISAYFTFGAGAVVAVGAIAATLFVLSKIVHKILNSQALKYVDDKWYVVKTKYARDFNIPLTNRKAVADWARQNLSSDQANVVIRAIEKCTSDLRSSERLKNLDSSDITALLESLLLLVAADFSVFEIFLGAAKEKDDPGGAVRHVLRQMREYQNDLKHRIEKQKQEDEERRRQAEEDKRWQEENRLRMERELREKTHFEEEERMRKERESVHGVTLKIDIPPSSMHNPKYPPSSNPATPSDDPLRTLASPKQDRDRSLYRTGIDYPPPSFCDRWEIVNRFDSSGGTMQKEQSQVVLQTPPNAVKPNLFADVCLAVCTDVEKIHHLFSLGDCDFVASPMVEVSAGADFLFELPVEITLPHCLPRRVSPEQLIIYRAAEDSEGKRVLWKVPADQDQAADRPSTHADVPWDDDSTFSVTDDRKIVINTRRFSGYTCIQCGVQNLGFPLLFVVGSGTNKVTPTQTQKATVDVHIWDKRLGILDFANNIQNRVTDAEQMTIDLSGVDPPKLNLNLRLDVTGQYSSRWKHSRGSDGLPSLPVEQPMQLKQVLACYDEVCPGNDKMKPYVVHWKLETSEPRVEALLLECAVHITFLPGDFRKEFPIELKEPLKTEQLMELPLPQLKRQLHSLGLPSDDIEAITAAEGNGDEDRVRRRLIERTVEIRGQAPSLDALTSHLGIDIRSRSTASSSANTVPKQVFRP